MINCFSPIFGSHPQNYFSWLHISGMIVIKNDNVMQHICNSSFFLLQILVSSMWPPTVCICESSAFQIVFKSVTLEFMKLPNWDPIYDTFQWPNATKSPMPGSNKLHDCVTNWGTSMFEVVSQSVTTPLKCWPDPAQDLGH